MGESGCYIWSSGHGDGGQGGDGGQDFQVALGALLREARPEAALSGSRIVRLFPLSTRQGRSMPRKQMGVL